MYLSPHVSSRPRTLADVGGSASLIRDALLVIGFSALMALCAQLSVNLPWTPVPITGQTLGVLLTGAALGPRRGLLAMVLYLVEGALGLPVFAGGTAGIARIIGPTGGFLVGFVLAAGVVGWLAARGWDRRLLTALLMFALGNLAIYVVGVAWLTVYKGLLLPNVSLVQAAVVPFLFGDALKIALAAFVLPSAWAIVNRTHDK